MHKIGRLNTIYVPFETRHEKGRNPLIPSTNQKVGGSNPFSRTMTSVLIAFEKL